MPNKTKYGIKFYDKIELLVIKIYDLGLEMVTEIKWNIKKRVRKPLTSL